MSQRSQQPTHLVLSLYPELHPATIPPAQQDREEVNGWLVAKNIHYPTLHVYLPEPAKAVGAGIVICPGGGYSEIAIDHEGDRIARWLNSLGVAAFVLRYRLPPAFRHPYPMRDAQQAMRMVRENAGQWGLRPDRIGMHGTSAGGHLVSTVATQSEADCRPDFIMLGYPVISFVDSYRGCGLHKNLCGPDAPEDLRRSLSSHLHVTPSTPPTFIYHASDDTTVDVQHSIAFYTACQQNGVPVEMHLFESGGHGFAIDKPCAPPWPALCQRWMEKRGLLA